MSSVATLPHMLSCLHRTPLLALVLLVLALSLHENACVLSSPLRRSPPPPPQPLGLPAAVLSRTLRPVPTNEAQQQKCWKDVTDSAWTAVSDPALTTGHTLTVSYRELFFLRQKEMNDWCQTSASLRAEARGVGQFATFIDALGRVDGGRPQIEYFVCYVRRKQTWQSKMEPTYFWQDKARDECLKQAVNLK